MQLGINPYEYNAYNEGAIIDSKPTKLVSRGFNVWDEQWEVGTYLANTINSKNKIRVIPNATYYLKSPVNLYVKWYDKNEVVIGSEITWTAETTKTSPINACYMTFRATVSYGTTYKNDICINISNASLNGTYRPYIAPYDYNLGSDLLKAFDYKVQSGLIYRETGELDITSSTNVERYQFSGVDYFNIYLANCISPNANENVMPLCNKYKSGKPINVANMPDKSIMYLAGGTAVIIRDDSITSADDFHIAYDNVLKVEYQLKSSAITTEQGTPLPENIAIQKGGTLTAEYDSTDNAPSDFEFDIATSKIV